MTAHSEFGIHWFRRDLRLPGNPALAWSWQRHSGRVLGLFCFDPAFLARADFSHNRFAFFLDSLAGLRDELRASGGDLLVLGGGPEAAWGEALAALKKNGAVPASVSWNRDYEPFAVQRDVRMGAFFAERGIVIHTERDHLLLEPSEVLKESEPRSPYQVFTPFSRKWKSLFSDETIRARVRAQRKGLETLRALAEGRHEARFSLRWPEALGGISLVDRLEEFRVANRARVTVPTPAAGSAAVLAALRSFAAKRGTYAERRDLPAADGTSHFSIFLKNGSLTVTQVIAHYELDPSGRPDKFLDELIWREFYYYILARFPHVERTAFRRDYDTLAWQNREDWFGAWREGRTGYPIVDAGMRQLKATGWMHNRVRMIVASFLTKDLLVDWRWGERWFMQSLLDGDLAPNNGGWQWAASTGCDAQPYFRVFNPRLQGEKFDPDGEYVRRWVPELAGYRGKKIHEPEGAVGYPRPIVDHGEQRAKALALFQGRGR